MPTIRHATTTEDFEAAQALFREYVASLDFDLDFQDVDEELEALPGPYAAPDGAILLAEVKGTPVGVVAVKPLDEPGVCEMKRLYVTPKYRQEGVGRALGEAVLQTARSLGYHTMRLDTVASMGPARSLYRSLGFTQRSAYYNNPLENVVYMERSL